MKGFFIVEIMGLTCLLAYCVQVLRLCLALYEEGQKPLPDKNAALPFLSLIVPVKYNARAFEHCLQSLVQQEYPHNKLQVLVVNDHADFDVASRIKNFAASYPTLNISCLLNHGSGKKQAILSAMASASGTHVVLTDADCTHPTSWLKT